MVRCLVGRDGVGPSADALPLAGRRSMVCTRSECADTGRRLRGRGRHVGYRTVLSLVVTLGLTAAAVAAPPASKGRRLPDFSLPDPAGQVHTRASLARDGVVLVVTAPTLSNEDAQRGWDVQLRAARPQGSRARLAFVEDLDQSWFPDTALEAMQEDYVAGQDPVLLIDRRGALRRALGVKADETVVLVFDARGTLRGAERGDPSKEAARRVWRALPPETSGVASSAPQGSSR